MKQKLKEKESIEYKFRIASGIFLMMFFICVISGLINLEEINNPYMGIFLIVCSSIFLVVSVWTFLKPFYPPLIGLAFYAGLTTWACLEFPDIFFVGSGKSKLFTYILYGYAGIGIALLEGYRELKKKKIINTPPKIV